MPHIHSIYDTDLHFIIDPITRSITSESGKVTLMQNDHNSERFTFEIPRYIEGHDMSLTDKVEIHYNNIDGSNKRTYNSDIYEVDDLQVSPDSDNMVIFSWLISKNATTYAGSLNFIARFVCYSDEEIEYQWFTDVFDKIKILSGIYNVDVMVKDYGIDILECWKRDVIKAFLESQVYSDTVAFKDEAKASAEAASISEANSKIYEINAESSASKAKVSEDNAKTSELNSKTSESNASVSEINAKISEENAKISEINAESSALNANISETNAELSATKAANEANAANESAINAAESERIVAETVTSLITKSGFIPKGEYDSTVEYDILNVVSNNNSLWICKRSNTIGIEPTKENSEYWQLAVELIPITEEEIDMLDPIVPTEATSSAITIDEIDAILV